MAGLRQHGPDVDNEPTACRQPYEVGHGLGGAEAVGAAVTGVAPATGRTAAGSMLGVVAAGAVGLPAVMAAELSPATTAAVAVDRLAERPGTARELGATRTVDASETDPARAPGGITGGQGADGLVEMSGIVEMSGSVDVLAARGPLVAVGAPPCGSEVSPEVNGLFAGKRIVGPGPRRQPAAGLRPGPGRAGRRRAATAAAINAVLTYRYRPSGSLRQ
ncbi:zinc-binding dehydrogenase [Streptomyces sp. NPDC001406]|uniref:zinc-binding dehydrogenase n=1 Tax=Streptomyces sp. NPDC001406 TaxID=3364572 RepID=UPI00368AB36E